MNKLKEMGQLATGIAHDIRSPLSALQLISGLPDLNRDDVRELLKATSSRIDGIAQGLLQEFKGLVAIFISDRYKQAADFNLSQKKTLSTQTLKMFKSRLT